MALTADLWTVCGRSIIQPLLARGIHRPLRGQFDRLVQRQEPAGGRRGRPAQRGARIDGHRRVHGTDSAATQQPAARMLPRTSDGLRHPQPPKGPLVRRQIRGGSQVPVHLNKINLISNLMLSKRMGFTFFKKNFVKRPAQFWALPSFIELQLLLLTFFGSTRRLVDRTKFWKQFHKGFD